MKKLMVVALFGAILCAPAIQAGRGGAFSRQASVANINPGQARANLMKQGKAIKQEAEKQIAQADKILEVRIPSPRSDLWAGRDTDYDDVQMAKDNLSESITAYDRTNKSNLEELGAAIDNMQKMSDQLLEANNMFYGLY